MGAPKLAGRQTVFKLHEASDYAQVQLCTLFSPPPFDYL